jgi:KRAB domain-containing zinc finger protein
MTTHTGNKQYACSACPESFISKTILERHMRFHGATPKLHRCEYCFMELSTETVLRRHIQKIHRQTAVCELCKIELPSKEILKEHLLTDHEPVICQVCNKTFTLPRYLKMHEKLHFEDQTARVTCSICTKSLCAKNIKAHVYRHHPEQFDSWLQAYQPIQM